MAANVGGCNSPALIPVMLSRGVVSRGCQAPWARLMRSV